MSKLGIGVGIVAPWVAAREIAEGLGFIPWYPLGAGTLLNMELPAIVWFERQGYDVEYGTNHDVGGPILVEITDRRESCAADAVRRGRRRPARSRYVRRPARA